MFEVLKEYWKEDMIDRANLEKITGGIVKAHTFSMQGNDNFMKQKAFKIGRETAYKIEDVIEWLNSNYEEIVK